MDSRQDYFKVLISPYLKGKLLELKNQFGEDSWEYQSVAKQYEFNPLEDEDFKDKNQKHYEANIGIPNMERLYKHHGCVEISFSCAAHCRFCLRSNYNGFVITDDEMDACVERMRKYEFDEILLTGGDPFLSPKILRSFIARIIERVPTMRIIRIATRTFTQNPALVNDKILEILSEAKKQIRVEVATQVGSPIELTWPETQEAFKKVLDLGIQVYSQNVFMKGINDTPEHLIALYENMRKIGITPHYLFLCCSITHIYHFRTSVRKYIDCYEHLVNSGEVTGRSKPILALMTGIGKITLTPFNVIEYKEGEYISIRSKYKLEDRLKWNPNYQMPEDAWVDENGYMCIRYLDGE